MKTILKPLFLLLVISFFSTEILAQTKLSVQGVIRLSDGNAIEDGLYPITFKLYDAETGGTELWSETQPQLKVTSGIYSTILGEVTPLDLEFDAFYFLSLTVEGEELLPRAPLTSAPYSNSVLGFDNVFPSTGNVGIGTLIPTDRLHVNGSTKLDGVLNVQNNILYVDNNNIGIGTNSPDNSYKMDVAGKIRTSNGFWVTDGIDRAFDFVHPCLTSGQTIFSADVWGCPSPNFDFIKMNRGAGIMFSVDAWGNVHYDGDLIDISDRRLKENLKLIEDPIEQLLRITGYSYNRIGEEISNREYGVIAQDVQKVFPEMVAIFDEDQDYLGVAYDQLIPVLIEAAKDLNSEIELLKKENEKLKSELSAQTELSNSRLNELESKLEEILKTKSVSKL